MVTVNHYNTLKLFPFCFVFMRKLLINAVCFICVFSLKEQHHQISLIWYLTVQISSDIFLIFGVVSTLLNAVG